MALLKLFNERVKAKPPVGSFAPAARSALRALGLAAGAAQAEVHDAASAVRLALKLDVVKTFESDAAWLFGPAARSEADARDAVGRLSEPAQRARERLFWFYDGAAPRSNVSNLEGLTRAVNALAARAGADDSNDSKDSNDPSDSNDSNVSDESVGLEGADLRDERALALHDAALLALAGAARFDPTLREPEAWRRAFDLWRRLFACEEFWPLLVAADLKGDFEQVVTYAEVAELRLRAPREVAAHVARRAGDAARAGNLPAAARALELLRGAGLPALPVREFEEEAVGPVEDKLTEELETAFCWVVTSTLTYKTAAERRNVCNDAWRRFEPLRPRLAQFARLAGADSPYARRVFADASSKLLRLAVAFEDVGRPQETLFVCRAARGLSPPGSEELRAVEERLRALGANEAARESGGDEYARALASEEFAAPPRGLFKNDPKGGQTLDSFKYKKGDDAAGCLTTVGFYVAVVAACFGLQWCGVINTRTTRRPVNLPPVMNVRPNLNFNLNLNTNYNIPPPLNLGRYTEPPPRGTTQPRGKKRRRPRDGAAADDAPMLAPFAPPRLVERAPNRNAPPRE